MNLSPGADLKKLQQAKPGDHLILAPGPYSGGITLTGLYDFTLDLSGAVLVGGTNGIKFVACHDFQIIGGESQGAKNYGFFFEKCQEFTVSGTKATKPGVTGFLTTHVVDASFLNCEATHAASQHGLYVSNQASKVRITGGNHSFNSRSGVQVNCDHGGATDVEIRNVTCEGNQGPGGAAAIQLAYVNGGQVLNNRILNHCGRAGIALFWHTRNVTVDQNEFSFAKGHGSACVTIDKSANGTIGPLNRAAPGVPLCVRE